VESDGYTGVFYIKRIRVVQENAGLLIPSEMSEMLRFADLLHMRVHPCIRVEPGKCGKAGVRVCDMDELLCG
jgi:hypothetical protein